MARSRAGQLIVGSCSCEDPDACGCVVVDSSIPSVVMSLIGPVMLAALAVFWIVRGAPGWVIGLLVVAIAVFGVVLFDMPISSVFNDTGVQRRTPLRDHHLTWDRIQLLSLTPARRAGVIASVGGRKYLLAERAGLSHDELDMLARMRPTT